MPKTLIKQGVIVTAADTYQGDILVEDERIVQIGQNLRPERDAEVIDATGCYVFPGAIDEHTHMAMPFNGTVTADWNTETVAAAIGGTTTIVDFAKQEKGDTLAHTAEVWKRRADGRTAIDYSLHVAITDLTDAVLDEIAHIVQSGVATLKLFMAYKGETMVDDATLLTTLQVARDVGALVMVHAENGDAIDILQRQLIAAGKTEPKYHAVSRPIEIEAEATRRAIALAKVADAPIFIVHVSGLDSLEEVRRARAAGQPVFAETCPQYLLLDESYLVLPDFEGAKYVCSPPLRAALNQEKLWHGLANGTLQAIGTDHCSFNFAQQKHLGAHDFRKIPNGVGGIENWIQLLYTYGVKTGRISLNQLVELTSTNPAKYMGLFPKKGTIAVGTDADIVVFDPAVEQTITAANQKQNSDYSVYEGFRIDGAPRHVLLRGKVIVTEGAYVGDLRDGQFVHANPYGAAYSTEREVTASAAEQIHHLFA
ncbi:dihydropyrimidinase [Alicyclobacillus acidoterrestris]|uniref:Dihydropyrimidinase n=1 Tax=Alicyclobacillus acidoterrestris (strain ATCC 49025 / DSM 3922 / CIP 106132 / NCIMB 13137 / GD3B) TaxID=1356854 RepID=T0D2A8_ALIAG|nr:dihydropyrimidinase [Alicyclobacillus acidoterrestris]EPZ45712.1 hypothetical protein N007_08020 [Alicyclobacillus acidoterrestris ATCC 49025]UNO50012.1 dihydropyrimidinase [Alicyclobacillus acidoterrestris]